MDEMVWPVFGVFVVFVSWLIVILNRYLAGRNEIVREKMRHAERLAAIDKGVPIPDWGVSLREDDLQSEEMPRRVLRRLRLASLSFGLFLAFGGLGMSTAFYFSGDDELATVASVGLIPMMAGIGLLLFYYLSKQDDDA